MSTTYQEPRDEFFATMLVKTGRSIAFDALFAAQANDIAVGVESILGIDRQRSIAPISRNVACHHLNYFVSEAGQRALTAVQW